MNPPVGKSGPGRCFIKTSTDGSGSSIRALRAAATSLRLWGGTFVLRPTAIPEDPLTRRFGTRGRKHGRLGALPIEILGDIHRFLPDVREDVLGNRCQLGFGVPIRRRGVAVDGAEVPLPVHERIAKRKVLDHPYERVVHGRIPMGVILAQDVAHHGRTFLVRPVRPQSRLVHGEEDAPVDRFETVPDIGKGPLDDHAHRVVEEGFSHLLLDEPRQDALARLGRHSISRWTEYIPKIGASRHDASPTISGWVEQSKPGQKHREGC